MFRSVLHVIFCLNFFVSVLTRMQSYSDLKRPGASPQVPTMVLEEEPMFEPEAVKTSLNRLRQSW